MNHLLFLRSLRTVAITISLAVFAFQAHAADVSYILAVKGALYEQTNTAAPFFSVTFPWVFNSEVSLRLPGLVTNATLKFSNVTSNLIPECHDWSFNGSYATSNALTAAFPNGTYTNTVWTLQDGVHSPVLSVTNNQFPANPPHVTNFVAAQSIDTTLPFKLIWDGFTGGTTNDLILLQIDNQNDDRIFETPLLGEPGALTGVSSNYTFPSNSLPPGQILSAKLIFARGNTSTTNAGYPGVRVIGAYFRETKFTMVTVGTPDTSEPLMFQSTPYDTETDVPVNSSIAFNFDRPMSDNQSIAWSGNVNSNRFTYLWLPNRQTLVCSYYTNLPANSTISWTLNPSGGSCGGFSDWSGNQLSADIAGSFDTGSTGAGVKDVLLYGCGKQQVFTQTNSATPTVTNEFQFQAFVELSAPYSITGGSVQPSNGVAVALSSSLYDNGGNFNFDQDFTNQAALDSTFTNGPYFMTLNCVHDGTRVATNNLTGNAYPNIPHVSNFAAAQSVNSTQDFILTWDAFSGGTTNDFIQVNLSDESGDTIFYSPNYPGVPGALNGLSNAIVIPAGSLPPGQICSGELFFAKLVTLNTNAYPGVTSLTFYGRRTDFTLQTMNAIPPPPAINQPARVSATQFGFNLGGVPGNNYTILTTTNLALPLSNWSTLLVTNLPSSSVFILDNQATNKQRFYRARFGP